MTGSKASKDGGHRAARPEQQQQQKYPELAHRMQRRGRVQPWVEMGPAWLAEQQRWSYVEGGFDELMLRDAVSDQCIQLVQQWFGHGCVAAATLLSARFAALIVPLAATVSPQPVCHRAGSQ